MSSKTHFITKKSTKKSNMVKRKQNARLNLSKNRKIDFVFPSKCQPENDNNLVSNIIPNSELRKLTSPIVESSNDQFKNDFEKPCISCVKNDVSKSALVDNQEALEKVFSENNKIDHFDKIHKVSTFIKTVKIRKITKVNKGTQLIDVNICKNQGERTLCTSSKSDSPGLYVQTPSLDSTEQYRCKLCSNSFASLKQINEHVKNVHIETIVEENLRNESQNAFFYCTECNRSFPTQRGWKKHQLLSHLKSCAPLACAECGKSFLSYRPLERHLIENHCKDTTNICRICKKEFVLQTSLDYHKEIYHNNAPRLLAKDRATYGISQSTNKKCFKCPLCEMIFPNSKKLRVHNISVHNDSFYNCGHCNYKTKSTTMLNKHLAQVHKAADIPIYSCGDCKAGYKVPEDLEEHFILVHKRSLTYNCVLCGHKFACAEMLRFHKSKHRAFSCTYCHLGFMKEETFKQHLDTVHKNDCPEQTANLIEKKSNLLENNFPILEIPQISDEKDSSIKVLEVNSDGSVEVKEDNDDMFIGESIQDKVTLLSDSKSLITTDIRHALKTCRAKDLPKKINCPICDKLLTKQFLRTHLLSHEGKLPHKCHVCAKAYAQGTLLRKHMKNKHYKEFLKMGNKNPKKKKLQCEFCEEVFYDVFPLEDHLWSHMDNKNYKCEMCGVKFGMKSNWMEHYKQHYFTNEKNCPTCNRGFKSIGFFREHTERCMSKWKCSICGLECCTEDLYRKHNRVVHSSQGRCYDCSYCGRKFSNKFNYKDHLLTHSSEKNFACSLCEKVFKRTKPLQAHIEKVHSFVLNHLCSYCGLTFNSLMDLQVHKREHRKEIPCPECRTIYLTQSSLDNHVLVNHNTLENQSVICYYCYEMFGKQIDLKNHLNSHFTDTVFVCQVNHCHKVFKKEGLLRSHMGRLHSHLEYLCHFCFQNFILDSDLQKHLETHKENDKFKCLKCKMCFNSKDQLQSHTMIHFDESPYECSLCKVKIMHKSNILKHIETVHNITENINDHVIVRRWKCSVCEKIVITHNSMMKHLEQHKAHGVKSAEGALCKVPLSQQFHSLSANFSEDEEGVWWEDLLPSLKIEVIAQSTNVKNVKMTTNIWQCPVCFVITKSDEMMKKHLLSSTSCQEMLLTSLTEKLSSKNDEGTSKNTNVQCVLVDKKGQLPSECPELKETAPFFILDNEDYVVVDTGDTSLEFINPGNETHEDYSNLNSSEQHMYQLRNSKILNEDVGHISLLNSPEVFLEVISEESSNH